MKHKNCCECKENLALTREALVQIDVDYINRKAELSKETHAMLKHALLGTNNIKSQLSDKNKIKMLINTVEMALRIERAALKDAEEAEHPAQIGASIYLIDEYEKTLKEVKG